MKGRFFYQNPNEEQIHGYECEVSVLSEVTDFEEGFLVTSFNKENIYGFTPIQEITVEDLNDVSLATNYRSPIEFSTYSQELIEAINYCKEREGKVVMSRVVQHDLPAGFKLSDFFTSLCAVYSHSFNYCFSIDGVTTWIGATPEVLVRSSDKGCITYSLAGSRSVDDAFEWTSKEKEEQQFVTDNISSLLKTEGLKYSLTKPRTIRAGNVEHILSEFVIETKDVLALADRLHPTPAVCGIPKEEALAFIKEHESHDRSFYAGIIGWKKKEDIALYVNLRCAEVNEKVLNCFVGGGVTKDSQIEKEWEETNFKSQTLLSVLKKN